MTRKNHRWTKKEIDYIRENYPTTPQKLIADHLNIAQSLVEAAIRRYDIKKHTHTWTGNTCKGCGLRRKMVPVYSYDGFRSTSYQQPGCNETR